MSLLAVIEVTTAALHSCTFVGFVETKLKEVTRNLNCLTPTIDLQINHISGLVELMGKNSLQIFHEQVVTQNN